MNLKTKLFLIACSAFVLDGCGVGSPGEETGVDLRPSISTSAGPSLVFTNVNAESDFAVDWATPFDHPGQWAQTLSNTDVVQLFEYDIPAFAPTSIQTLVKTVARRRQAIGVEMQPLDANACDMNPNGSVDEKVELLATYTAQHVIANLQPVYDAGGYVSYAAIDSDGINTVLANAGSSNNCNLATDDAIDAAVYFMQIVHVTHPEIQFGLIANFPNYNYAGTNCYWAGAASAACRGSFMGEDYADVLDRQVAAARGAGEDYTFVHADNPYNYMSNHHGGVDVMNDRVLTLRNQASDLGMRFGLIINTDLGDQPSTPAVDREYRTESVADIDLLTGAGGGPGDDFIVESWFAYPGRILPEATENTFTFIANEDISYFKALMGDTSPPAHRPSP